MIDCGLDNGMQKEAALSVPSSPHRIAVNEYGRVGLQFRNRIAGAQPLLFQHEQRRA